MVSASESLHLGAFVRERRESLGLSQTELAERTGLARPHLSDIERGKIALPNADTRRRLAAALGLSHVELLVAAGELSEQEVSGRVGPGLSPAQARLLAVVDGLDERRLLALAEAARLMRFGDAADRADRAARGAEETS